MIWEGGVVVPSGQTGMLVGLPPLSEETYLLLDATLKAMYAEHVLGEKPKPAK